MFDGTSQQRLSEQRQNYHYFGQYKCPLLYYALLQNWADPQDASHSLPLVSGQIVVLDGHQFILQKDWDSISQATVRALETQDSVFFEDFLSAAIENTAPLFRDMNLSSSDFDLKSFLTSVHRLQYPWYLVLPMAQELENWLKPKLPEEDLIHFFQPDQLTLYAEYQQACRAAHTQEDIENICMRFAWVGYMHFWGDGNSREKVVDQFVNLTIDTGETAQYVPSTELAWVYRYTRRITYYRQHFAELCSLATLKLKEFLASKGISLRDVWYITPEELVQLLDTGVSVSHTMVEERERGYGLFNTVVTGQELKRLTAILVDKVESANVIKGTVASKGTAEGFVTVILSPMDMKKMQTGNILVAHETTPDLVSAMSLASAIITDVGGLTSHAAIVSREMKKPCIIGTMIGTKILKDGDRVEVDAERGVVTILERKKV